MKTFLRFFAFLSFASAAIAQTFPVVNRTTVSANPNGTLAAPTTFWTANASAISAALASSYQPLDADLTAIAGLTTTAFGRSTLSLADAAAGRALFGLATLASSASASDLTAGTLAAARLPAFTGDITTTAGSAATTLSTVNANVGSFGSATQIPNITVDAKGRISAAGVSSVAPPWSAIASKPTTIAGYGITDAAFIVLASAEVWIMAGGSDATGALGRSDKPFASLSAAYAALPSSGGVMRVGVGVFAPLDSSIAKPNVRVLGSGRPNYKADLTGLEGGTIIRGPLVYEANNVEFRDLGVDSGSAVCAALYSGVAQEGLVCTVANLSGDPQFYGLVVSNVIAICKDAGSAVHAFAAEGYDRASIESVDTHFGVHGQAYKLRASTVSHLRAGGHGTNGVIIKSDEIRQSSKTSFSHIYVDGESGVTDFGINLECNRDIAGNYQTISEITVSDFVVNGANTGLILQANATSGRDLIRDCVFSNGLIVNSAYKGIHVFGYAKNNSFSGVDAHDNAGTGLTTHASSVATRYSGSLLRNGANGAEIYGTRETVEINADGNTGYGLVVGAAITAYGRILANANTVGVVGLQSGATWAGSTW